MGLMLEVTSGNTGFLDMVGNLLTKMLSWGTQVFEWILSTEAVAYGLGIGLILAAILIIKRVKNV